MEWDGWIFIFNRTCCGWKYATHTFSDFTKAVKLKTQGFNRNGWLCSKGQGQRAQWFRVVQRLCFHDRLPTVELKKKAAQSRMNFLTLGFVDDVWAHTFNDLGRAEKLAAILRISRFLLLGYNGFGIFLRLRRTVSFQRCTRFREWVLTLKRQVKSRVFSHETEWRRIFTLHWRLKSR